MHWLTFVKLGYVAFFLALSAIAWSLIDPAAVAPLAFTAHPVNATVQPPASIAQTLALARRGNADAEYRLGRAYATGRGVPLNDSEAAAWYTRAAALGNAAAETRLGWAYYIGAGVPRSTASARRWLAAAADRGDRHAAHRLAVVEQALAPTDLAAVYRR